jgi:hypothetical protein
LAAARDAAAASRDGDPPAPAWRLEEPTASARQLAEWAIIEPEQAQVYSTRRFGKPITLIKRLLIRLLSQYLGQMSAQQSRFNAQVAAHVIRLEERVQALEAAAARVDDGTPGASRKNRPA